MRVFTALWAGFVLSAATPPADLRQFDDALSQSASLKAAAIIDRMVEDRTPPDGKAHPDSLLNSMIGRFELANGGPNSAWLYLSHVDPNELPTEARLETALAFADVLDYRGDRAGSIAAYREALSEAPDQPTRQHAAIGIARELLAGGITELPPEITEIANGPSSPDRWEANSLLAVERSLQGDQAGAAQYAARAWSDSALAAAAKLGPLRVAVLESGLAAVKHDQARELAMLTAAGGLSAGSSASVIDLLPVCGDGGVQPGDSVLFGVYAGPNETRGLIPVWATKTANIPIFYDRLANHALLNRPSEDVPAGTVMSLSCRTNPGRSYYSGAAPADPADLWFVDHGYYAPLLSSGTSDDDINAIAKRIDALSARFGKDSPLLIRPRLQYAAMLTQRAGSQNDVSIARILDLYQQVADGFERVGAPPELASTIRMISQGLQMLSDSSGQPDGAKAQALIKQQLAAMPFASARRAIDIFAADFHDTDAPASLAQAILDLNQRTPATLDQRERQGWAETVAWAQRSLGKPALARKALQDAGLSLSLCDSSDVGPVIVDSGFTGDSYPTSLLPAALQGSVVAEVDVGPTGKTSSPRVLISAPSGMFDEATLGGIPRTQYTPAKRSGKDVACRAQVQRVVWRMEDRAKAFTMPNVLDGAGGDAT